MRQLGGWDEAFSNISNLEYLRKLVKSSILELKIATISDSGIVDLRNRLLKLQGFG